MTSLPFMKNGKTKIAVNKSKFFSKFPTRVKLGSQCGSYPYSMWNFVEFWIGIVLMLIRILIWIGVRKMKIRIRIVYLSV
jgi:hypothetical protein